jgi:hypothetical protein
MDSCPVFLPAKWLHSMASQPRAHNRLGHIVRPESGEVTYFLYDIDILIVSLAVYLSCEPARVSVIAGMVTK